MASISLVSSKPSAWSGSFEYTITQNIMSNYTKIDIRVWAQKNDGHKSGTNSTTWNAQVVVNGKEIMLQSGPGYALSPNGTWIGEDSGSSTGSVASFTVYHNNDGSLNCPISITVYPASGLSWAGERLSYSGNFGDTSGIHIPKIPRSSVIDSAKDVSFGDACQITWTPPSASFYYKLKFVLGERSEEVGPFCPGVTTSYPYADYIIPCEFASEIPNSTSATMSATLYTYDSSACDNIIGTASTATFTVTVPDNEDFAPKIDSAIATVNNKSSSAIQDWDVAISGHSRIDIDATASGAYGSTISSFTIDLSTTVTPSLESDYPTLKYTSGLITVPGRKQYIITCTDSRGRVSSQYIVNEVVVLPYSSPRITKFTVSKNTKETDDVSDDRMIVVGEWGFDRVNDGEKDLNSTTAVVYYKQSTANEWTLHGGALESGKAFEIDELELDDTRSYNFKIVVTDSVGTVVQKEAFSSTTTVLMDFQAGGKGLGIGKICEIDNSNSNTGSLEVSMSSYFWGDVRMMGSSLFILGNDMFGDESPEDKFAGIAPVKGQIYFKKVGN